MSYDFYAEFLSKQNEINEVKIDRVVNGQQVPDIAARLTLLAGITAAKDNLKTHVISGDRTQGGGYLSLVHNKNNLSDTPYAQKLIIPARKQLEDLGIFNYKPDLNLLPPGSWFLQFSFTLATPWMSKDDDLFYVAESINPVRKDKVFKMPMMSASSWKGLLRWTAVRDGLVGHLIENPDGKSPSTDILATKRFVYHLLFGDEKGEGDEKSSGLASYLQKLTPEADEKYRQLMRTYYDIEADDPLPNHSGRLMFYPTFFNRIDVEVINPHSRETRAGLQPVYLECVPIGASGVFSLLYVPFDQIGEDMSDEGQKHLSLVALLLSKLFLRYGFSAKRSSGYGLALDNIEDGKVVTRRGEKTLTSLRQLTQEVKNVAW